MARKLQLRRGTAAQWTAANPVLAQGEPGFEYDTGKLKYGDGSTAWNSLTYAGGSGAAITALSALTPASGKVPYFTGASTAAMVDSTSYGRALLNVADEAALKALINAEAGTDFATPAALTSGLAGKQDLNSRLTGIANMASLAVGDLVQWDGTNFVRLAPGTNGHFLKSNGAGVAPSYAAVSQTGRWSRIETQQPTSDVSTITFAAALAAYQQVEVTLLAQMISATYPAFECSPDNATWRTVALGPITSSGNNLVSWHLRVMNVDNGDGTNLRMVSCIHSATKSATLDRSSNATNFNATGIDTQAGTGGYTSYTENFNYVRFRANAGNFEGSNSDQRVIAQLWGMN
jgi:hypothetical protein